LDMLQNNARALDFTRQSRRNVKAVVYCGLSTGVGVG
jgi:hypothetical protein